jgi:hypothetical protein
MGQRMSGTFALQHASTSLTIIQLKTRVSGKEKDFPSYTVIEKCTVFPRREAAGAGQLVHDPERLKTTLGPLLRSDYFSHHSNDPGRPSTCYTFWAFESRSGSPGSAPASSGMS